MAYGLQTTGGTWWDSNSSFDTPVYSETVTSDIATQSQDVQKTASNDGWTDWFKNIAGSVLEYSIKKDAALTGVELQRAGMVQPQTTYPVGSIRQTPAPVISANMLLLIAAGVGVYMLAKD
jgi:hypothetical protein